MGTCFPPASYPCFICVSSVANLRVNNIVLLSEQSLICIFGALGLKGNSSRNRQHYFRVRAEFDARNRHPAGGVGGGFALRSGGR